MGTPIIEFKNFSYYYPNTEEPAIKQIHATIEEGDFVGLIGPNKAGKSTACLSMIGIAPHILGGDWMGDVVVNHETIQSSNVSDFTKIVGVVFQDAESQFTQETVEDEIAFAMCNMGFERSEMIKRVNEVAISCNLTEFLERSPFQLSGGQQQRLAVACLLALRPKVIILDESTSQLDPKGRDEVFKLVKELHRQGRTIIMVDHNIEKMAEYTTKLMVFFEGELKLYGPTSEILQQKELLNDYHIRLPQVTDAAYGLKETYQFTKLPINLEEASRTFKEYRGQENGSNYSNQESCP
ncbi:energy-coupling factor ABC transporter ATP-binding protein [Pseudoneobacillus rhizosphaerae]|uniref:Vitamin B12 import ATP-binding protein BtuD n=1 Tax=Pseudoneobacillus rhizosphaerae TaxID=2880968 RepID=A0A9C7LA79_9BACI|nr:ABC transporter ATP-binding protein [Pseudoneobacillus rhizosphaerae]CAG9607767.1 Vitamin B12 import ATP-binding protein BtuD [Pseudoneobacillus rhizosphaerae]